MKDNINGRMTKEAWKKDRASTVSLVVFVALSVALVSLTVMLFANLTGAIDQLMKTAGTPDFLQMHEGTVDTGKLEAFAESRPEIRDYQVAGFLNLENSILALGDASLRDSTQDNGLSVQGDGFDYMVGIDQKLPEVQPGEVYVPVCYESMYHVKIGDAMTIGDSKLTIAGFIRDSQMNSMMASSKRFLVCRQDYENFKSLGSEEALIEFLLAPDTDTNDFQAAYEAAGLPTNGPAITRPLVRMMNTLSDGMMIMIILLISVMVLLISLVCIRFLLLTRVISETKEVGVMKAVGISGKDIRKMFLARYRCPVLAGGVAGIVIAAALFEPLAVQMQKLYGVTANEWERYLYAVLSAALIAGGIFLFIRRVLKRLNKMTALSVLTGTAAAGQNGEKKNGRMLCIMIVTMLAVFLMLVPSNLYSTISSPEFVTYMGVGNAQIRLDLRQGAAEEEFLAMEKTLAEDTDIWEYALYQTSRMPVRTEDGDAVNMLMETGDHSRFPVSYCKGHVPDEDGEVAVSYLLSEELGLYPGDEIFVQRDGEYKKYTISGVYSDITNGGKTAKMFAKQPMPAEEVMWRIAYVVLKNTADQQQFVDRYSSLGIQVTDMEAQIQGTYGPTIQQVGQVAGLVKIVAALILLVVVTMFVRMTIAARRNSFSIKKAMGFQSQELQREFWKSCIPATLAGLLLGTLCGCIFGEMICGMAMKSFGAGTFAFIYNPAAIAVNILIGAVAAGASVYLGGKGIKRIKAVECCKGGEAI